MPHLADAWYVAMTQLMENDVIPLARQYWESRSFEDVAMREARTIRKRGYQTLLEQLQGFASDPAPSLRAPKGTVLPEVIEEEIHTRLSLWYCSYFLGFPLPHIWEPVHHLQSVLEGYTGSDALYAKLAGDVYRAERKTQARAQYDAKTSRKGLECRSREMLVLAFSPILLLPNEGRPAVDPASAERCGYRGGEFVAVLTQLSSYYLRLQIWLYLACGNPIRYAFEVEAAAKALRQILPDADEDARRTAVYGHFKLMGGTEETLLCAVPESLMKGDVWTSCTLGEDDGALTDRPQKLGDDPTRRSTWVRSQYLVLEREKMNSLLCGQRDPGSQVSFRPEIAIKSDAIEALLSAAAAPHAR